MREMGGVMVEMAKVVEVKFHLVERQPREARCCIEIRRRRTGFHLSETDLVVLQYLGLGVWGLDRRHLTGRPRAWTEILIILPVLRPRTKVRFGRLKVEMRVEQRVVGNLPKPVRIPLVFP